MYWVIRRLYLCLGLFAFANYVNSATEYVQVEQRVISSLRLVKKSDMIFPDAISGDSAYTIPPGSTDTSENASFLVLGEPGKVFRVVLPQNGQVKLRLKHFRDRRSVVNLNQFKSNITNNIGRINKRGKKSLFIGATRDSLLPNQKSGVYRGQFQVTVVY